MNFHPLGGYKVKPRLVSLKLAMYLIGIEVVTGTIVYMTLEGFRFLDALYMTVITISTVGFSEVQELSDVGHIFTIFLILFNFVIIAYALYAATYYIFEGQLFKNMHEKFITKKIEEMTDHVILCGYGRYGREATNHFENHKVQFLIIDNSEAVIDKIQKDDRQILYIKGDSTNDEVLLQAGIKRAKSLISALPDDADNVFSVLTARQLNPALSIISRAHNAKTASKLRLAGANHVIMPEKIGGVFMASIVNKPNAVEFFSYLTAQYAEDMGLTEIEFKDAPTTWQGKNIGELSIQKKTGANIIGMKQGDGKFVINPLDDQIVTSQCSLILVGNVDQLNKLKQYISDQMEHK